MEFVGSGLRPVCFLGKGLPFKGEQSVLLGIPRIAN